MAQPAAHLQMVVEGSHLEHTLAVAQLEVAHLDDIGQGFHQKDEAQGDEHDGHIVAIGQGRDHTAKKQGAGVPHEALGGVEVIHQKAQQPAYHAGGDEAHLLKLIAKHQGQRHKKQEHRDGGAGSQTIDPVGNVHGVDSAHDDEGGDKEIQPFRHVNGLIHKEQVKAGAHIADLAHQKHKHQRGHQLQQELGLGREAQILLLGQLLPVVQKADGAEHAGEQDDENIDEFAPEHPLKADREADQNGRKDEHHAAHGGGAGFTHVPGGAVFLDLLPGLDAAQPGNIELTEGGGKQEGQNEGGYQFNGHCFLPYARR